MYDALRPFYFSERADHLPAVEMAAKDKVFRNRTQGPQARYHFQVFIVDEAQRIKNFESK
jgi:hypothetical protein